MLKLRILTAAVLLPLFVAALWLLPNPWWAAALVPALLVAGREWARLAAFGRVAEILFLALLLTGYALLWFAGSAPAADRGTAATLSDRVLYALSLGFWCIVAPGWLWLRLNVRNRAALAVVGLVILLPTWLALTRLQHEPRWLLLVLAVVWIADSAAYFAGRAWGRRKLAPAISPGKTWEGVAGAFAAVTVYALLLRFAGDSGRSAMAVFGTFMAMTALSISGDLFESWSKRQAGVKDSGNLLPGHGGILDRIDGMTAALPLAALMFA